MFIPYKIEEEYAYRHKPVLVYVFCAVYIIAHVTLYHFMTPFQREDIFFRFGCVPSDFKWWSPITCTFLHGSWLHLIGNLYFFWIYGRSCEKYLGSLLFLIIYIAGAFVSVWAHVLTVPVFYQDVPTIGASGAISAVLGCFLVLFPHVKIRFLVFSVIYSRPLPSHGPAYFVLGSWFIIQIFYGLQLVGNYTEVAFWAHIAGFAAGAMCGSLYLIWQNWRQKENSEKQARLTPVWQAFCQGDFECRNLIQEEIKPITADKAAPENWNLLNSLFSEIIDRDQNASMDFAIQSFIRARQNKDYPLVCQIFYWIITTYDNNVIPGWVFSDGAIASARLKHYQLAVHGFYWTIKNRAFEQGDRLLLGISTALEKIGETETAGKVKSLLKQYFPDSPFTNK